MYSWGEDTSDWYGSAAYRYTDKGKDARVEAERRASAAGPRSYAHRSEPNPALVDPHKTLRTTTKNPLIVAVDVTGSMSNWPFEIFDRLPLLYNTLVQYREDLEICFAAIGDAGADRWPLQVTSFAKGYDLEQQLGALYGEGGGGDAPESYGLFAYWALHNVETPNAQRPFLIVFGDAPMHEKVPQAQIQRLIGARAEASEGGLWNRLVGAANGDLDALGTWKQLAEKWNTWFLRRPTGRRGDEVDVQWAHAIGSTHVFHIDDEQRAVDYAMGLVARSWGCFGDFESNMRARQDAAKVEKVAKLIRTEGPKVLACPTCAARLPEEAMGRVVCSYCKSTLEL